MPRTDYSDVEVIEPSPSTALAHASSVTTDAAVRNASSRNLEAHSNVLVSWRHAAATAHSKFQPVSDSVLPSELNLPIDASANGAPIAAGIPTDVTEAGATNLRNAAEQIWKRCMETLRGQLSAQTMRTWFEPLEPGAHGLR